MGCRRKNTLCLSLDFGANDGTLLPRLTRLETSPSPQKRLVLKFPIHPCHTAAILDILGMKSRRCVANLRFAVINHAKQRFQCALMCPCVQITDQKAN